MSKKKSKVIEYDYLFQIKLAILLEMMYMLAVHRLINVIWTKGIVIPTMIVLVT